MMERKGGRIESKGVRRDGGVRCASRRLTDPEVCDLTIRDQGLRKFIVLL